MSENDFYRLTTPTVWAEAPERFSFSSLNAMGTCLRRWQLLHSKFPSFARYPERPSEAAAVGTIVHDLLSRLLGAMVLAGYPAAGSTAFGDAIVSVEILRIARAKLADFKASTTGSPRAGGMRLKTTPRDVYNKVCELFHGEYAGMSGTTVVAALPKARALEDAGAAYEDRLRLLTLRRLLSEETLRHPTLPLMGIIDLLVHRDGKTTVIDFKTGAVHAGYRAQLAFYALLWWRATGDLPATIEVRYATGAESWEVTEEELVAVERGVEKDIARIRDGLKPALAIATIGEHCSMCGVRQLCRDYWQRAPVLGPAPTVASWVDAEVWVDGTAAPAGFMGRDGEGRAIPVVFDEEVGFAWAPFVVGEGVRLLGAAREAETGVLRITKGTEVFRTLA